MVCLSRPYSFKFFKGYVPQILLGPFLNIMTYIYFFYLNEMMMHFSKHVILSDFNIIQWVYYLTQDSMVQL